VLAYFVNTTIYHKSPILFVDVEMWAVIHVPICVFDFDPTKMEKRRKTNNPYINECLIVQTLVKRRNNSCATLKFYQKKQIKQN